MTATRKYLVDISGQLPTIVCVVDAADPNLVKSSYFYADAQVLAQRTYPDPNVISDYARQFYVHDRLGSVRLVVDYNDIDEYVSVANSYTYTPFGSHYDGEAPAETLDNPFKFTGQWHDAEINQYYLRARQYDPAMMRFTSRDPVKGKYKEPLTLHKYLYCLNDPIGKIDLSGENAIAKAVAAPVVAGHATHALAVTVAAYAVWTGRDALMPLAIALESSIKDVMASVAIGVGFMDSLANASVTYNDHLNDLVSLNAELARLEEELGNAGGPKKRGPLEELIRKIKEQIDGKVKEMKQKWPDKIQ